QKAWLRGSGDAFGAIEDGGRAAGELRRSAGGVLALSCGRRRARRGGGSGRQRVAAGEGSEHGSRRRGLVSARGGGSEDLSWLRPDRRTHLVQVQRPRRQVDAADHLLQRPPRGAWRRS